MPGRPLPTRQPWRVHRRSVLGRAAGPRRRQRAQSAVEVALALPVFLLLLFMTVDVARAAYTWVMLGQDAEAAARQVSLPDNQTSDCSAITGVATSGSGLSVSADPKSIINDGSPAASPAPYTTPTQANTGYLYIYPAQATANPPASNCANSAPGASSPQRTKGSVTARVTFDFVPWTPFAAQLAPKIILSAQATEQTQY